MSTSKSVELSLILNDKNQRYTPLDTIRGKVNLKVYKEITINNIKLNFKGTSNSKFEVYPEGDKDIDGKPAIGYFVKSESHTLVNRDITVFPPDNVRKVSKANQFTLTPGEYSYDFELEIPLHNECSHAEVREKHRGNNKILPPSFSSPFAEIRYVLKATVKRSSWFKSNNTIETQPQMSQFIPIDDIIANSEELVLKEDHKFDKKVHKRIAKSEKPTGPESYEVPVKKTFGTQISSFMNTLFGGAETKFANEFSVPFTFEARFPGGFLTIDEPLNMMLYITSKESPDQYKGIDGRSSGLGEFYLTEFKIKLTSKLTVRAQRFEKTQERDYILCAKEGIEVPIDLANMVPNPAPGNVSNKYQVGVPHFLYKDAIAQAKMKAALNNQEVMIEEEKPDILYPSFETCNVRQEYSVNVAATFKSSASGWFPSWSSTKVPLRGSDFSTNVKLITGIPPSQKYLFMKAISPQMAHQILSEFSSEPIRNLEAPTPDYQGEPTETSSHFFAQTSGDQPPPAYSE